HPVDVSRLPYLRRDELDHEAEGVWDAVVAVRGPEVFNDAGGLVGPFNAWLHAPEVGGHLSALGAVLRFGTSLDRRLVELAILVVGAHWKAEFEWWFHSRLAARNGVSDAVIAAIEVGATPSFDRGDEAAVYGIVRELVADGRVTSATYDDALAMFGPRGVVELVSLCGYYVLVSFTLNAFEIPLPPGESAVWSA
ncbi:MAG: 4-carboxymuconolactone decarboxylase, partial [Acidimicrobiaceae bacterium]